jgi:hypothetical protein
MRISIKSARGNMKNRLMTTKRTTSPKNRGNNEKRNPP